LVVRIEAHEIDLIAGLFVLCSTSVGRAFGHHRVGGEHAAQFGIGGDDFEYNVASGRLAIGIPK
jgi:hypothetical protein